MIDCIVDANSMFARAYFAVTGQHPGAPVEESLEAAVQSALFTLGNLGERPDRVLFCFDDQAKKDKGRSPKPESFGTCLARYEELLPKIVGGRMVRMTGYEADDVVATAAFDSLSERVYVVSGDKDLHQLQSDRVSIYDLNTKGVLSRHTILARWNVKRPAQSAIALAILGDPRDNIPGIKGWGPKKVAKLFEQVSPSMGFEEALHAIEQQIPEALKAEFYTCLELTLLNISIPGVPDPAPFQVCGMDDLYELGFGALEPTWTRLTGPGGVRRLNEHRESRAGSLIDRLGV